MMARIGGQTLAPVALGCMNLSHAYGTPPEKSDGIKLLNQALDLGYNMLDTDPAMVHQGHQNKEVKLFANYDDSSDTVIFSVKDPKAELREFGISTTTELRDALDQGLVIDRKSVV